MYMLVRHAEGRKERSKQGLTNNKAKQHSRPKAVTFPKKNVLPRVGLKPMILHTLYSKIGSFKKVCIESCLIKPSSETFKEKKNRQ